MSNWHLVEKDAKIRLEPFEVSNAVVTAWSPCHNIIHSYLGKYVNLTFVQIHDAMWQVLIKDHYEMADIRRIVFFKRKQFHLTGVVDKRKTINVGLLLIVRESTFFIFKKPVRRIRFR